MEIPYYYQQRIQDLEDNIQKNLKLHKELEDELRLTIDPTLREKYTRDIKRQQQSVTKYEQELVELQQNLQCTFFARNQQADSKLEHINTRLNILRSSQILIYEDLRKQLDENQLFLNQKLQDALDANQLSETQMEKMLALLEEHIPSLISNPEAIADVIKDPKLDIKQKLKVTLPIVPLLAKYEGEFELESEFNLKSAWKKLIAKLQKKN